jgi:hypothetical protein
MVHLATGALTVTVLGRPSHWFTFITVRSGCQDGDAWCSGRSHAMQHEKLTGRV